MSASWVEAVAGNVMRCEGSWDCKGEDFLLDLGVDSLEERVCLGVPFKGALCMFCRATQFNSC